MSSINHEIDRQAAVWAAKRDLRALSVEEQVEFEAWLAADVRHLGAYGRSEAILSRLERVSGVVFKPGTKDESQQPCWSRRRILLTGGAAAGAVMGVGITDTHDTDQQRVLSTEIGQMREAILSDGSTVFLNTDSRIVVGFNSRARNIELLRGEVLFDVAKNRRCPFSVFADGTNVRAVGTSFMVSRLPNKPVKVLVREGVVELQIMDAPKVLPVQASANTQVTVVPGVSISMVAMPRVALERDLAWRHGSIALDNQTLSYAADEFARYSKVHIVVDPTVSDRTVTGLFTSNDPIGFAKASASVLGLQVRIKDGEVEIF